MAVFGVDEARLDDEGVWAGGAAVFFGFEPRGEVVWVEAFKHVDDGDVGVVFEGEHGALSVFFADVASQQQEGGLPWECAAFVGAPEEHEVIDAGLGGADFPREALVEVAECLATLEVAFALDVFDGEFFAPADFVVVSVEIGDVKADVAGFGVVVGDAPAAAGAVVEPAFPILGDGLSAMDALEDGLGGDTLEIPFAQKILALVESHLVNEELLVACGDAPVGGGAVGAWDFVDAFGALFVFLMDGASLHFRAGDEDEEGALCGSKTGLEVFDGVNLATGGSVVLELVGDGDFGHFVLEGGAAIAAQEVDEHAAELEEELAEVVGAVGEDLLAEALEGGLEADFVDVGGLVAGVDGEDDVLGVVVRHVADAIQRALGDAGDVAFHPCDAGDGVLGCARCVGIYDAEGTIGGMGKEPHFAGADHFLVFPCPEVFLGVVESRLGGHAAVEEDVLGCPDGERLGGDGGECLAEQWPKQAPRPRLRDGLDHSEGMRDEG